MRIRILKSAICGVLLIPFQLSAQSVIQNPEKSDPARMPVMIDVSGKSGQNASHGSSGMSGSDGRDSGQASIGTDGQSLDLRFEILPRPNGEPLVKISGSISKIIPLHEIDSILIKAIGGNGGHGGRGGDGGEGRKGKDGTDAGAYSYPSSGKDGERGGDGGSGSSGMNGGRGGDVTIRIAKKDSVLLALLHIENQGGRGGKPGTHGRGGAGGAGGKAGSRTYWDFSDGEFKTKGFFTSNGNSGPRGRDGHGRLDHGADGSNGKTRILVEDSGQTTEFNEPFKLNVNSIPWIEQTADQLFQPGEKVTLDRLLLENDSNMPVPEGLQLVIEHPILRGDAAQFELSEALFSGEHRTLEKSQGGAFVVDTIGALTAPRTCPLIGLVRFGGYSVEFPMAQTIRVGLPLLIQTTQNSLEFTKKEFTQSFDISIQNLSNDVSSIPMNFSIQAVGGDLPAEDVMIWTEDGEQLKFDERKSIWRTRLDQVAGNQTKILKIFLAMKSGTSWNRKTDLVIDVQTEWRRSDGDTQRVQLFQRVIPMSFQMHSLNIESYSKSVRALNIFCKLKSGNEYAINHLWINKDSKVPTKIVVQYEIDSWGTNNSPKYWVLIEDVGNITEKLSSDMMLTQDEALALFNGPLKNYTIDHGNWSITSCRKSQ